MPYHDELNSPSDYEKLLHDRTSPSTPNMAPDGSRQMFGHVAASQPARSPHGGNPAYTATSSKQTQRPQTLMETYGDKTSRRQQSTSESQPQDRQTQKSAVSDEEASSGNKDPGDLGWRPKAMMERYLSSTERHEGFWQYNNSSDRPRSTQQKTRKESKDQDEEESIDLNVGGTSEERFTRCEASKFGPPLPK